MVIYYSDYMDRLCLRYYATPKRVRENARVLGMLYLLTKWWDTEMNGGGLRDER